MQIRLIFLELVSAVAVRGNLQIELKEWDFDMFDSMGSAVTSHFTSNCQSTVFY